MFSAFKKFGRMGGGSSIPWSPTALFAAGEAGGLWDFSTLANLYQDSAGTTPCTAVGDPIGKVLDTSGRGNHLTQSTSTKRPTLGYDSGTGLYYASFDGVDDCLVSPSIDFSGTDKMSVFAGLRKTSDASTQVLCELSAAADLNSGTFNLIASNPADGLKKFQFVSKGSAAFVTAYTTSTSFDAPKTLIATGISDISGDMATLRLDGVQIDQSTADQGTGNYGGYPIYVGQRNADLYPYKGFLSALCARGAATDATTVTSMEKWLATRTPGTTL